MPDEWRGRDPGPSGTAWPTATACHRSGSRRKMTDSVGGAGLPRPTQNPFVFRRVSMFEKVSDPDFIHGEHEVLRFWRDWGIFDKRRRANAGKKTWSFLDGR